LSSASAPTSPDTERLARLVRDARSVVALTGAGISVPSGIPDFRTPGSGLWSQVDPMEVAHIDAFVADPARFWRFYSQRFTTVADKQPNDAHRALVQMERARLLDGVITQNVDMLHRKAGTRELVEVHGSIATCSCFECRASAPLEDVRAMLAAEGRGREGGERERDCVPRCERCGGAMRPDVVLFGELLPSAALERAGQLCEGADVLLCVGSSLEVHPVAGLPALVAARGGAIAIITTGSTPLDELADVRLHGDVERELRALVSALEIA